MIEQPDISKPETVLTRLLLCLDEQQKNTLQIGGAIALIKRIAGIEDTDNVDQAASEWLYAQIPNSSDFTELHNYDYHPAKLAWDTDVLDVLFGVNSEKSDQLYAEQLVVEYLRGAEEFDIPLPCDFNRELRKEEAYGEMVRDLQQQAIKLIKEWRENVIRRIEKYDDKNIEPAPQPCSLLSVGDKETDDLLEWDTVWEPSLSDECIQEFVEYPDDEEDEDCSDEGTINYRRLLKHLHMIAPHIDWRLEDKGYDYDDGGGSCWNAIAVPNEQLHEAEIIIERIEQSDDIMQFSRPEDFASPIYDEHGELRAEITGFVASTAELRRFVYSGYLQNHSEAGQQAEEKIMHLIRLLADLYASGARLALLKNDAELDEYPCQSMSPDFQNVMMERYGRYLQSQEINPFEQIAYACECLDSVQELYDEGNPHDVARAVADWQFGFRSGAGWASSVLDALKTLHELYSVIRYGRP